MGFGRRKFWHFVGTCIVVCAFYLLFGACIACDVEGNGASALGKAASFGVAASVFNVGWAFVQVSHMALVPDLTTYEDERVLLNSARYGATIVANLLVFVVMLGLLGTDASGAQSVDVLALAYERLTLIVLGVGGVASLLFLLGTPERLGGPRGYAQIIGGGGGDDGARAADSDDEDGGGKAGALGAASFQSSSGGLRPASLPHDGLLVEVPAAGGGVGTNQQQQHPHLLGVPAATAQPCEWDHPMTWRDWLAQPCFWVVAGVYMLTRLAVNVSQVYLSLYVRQALLMPPTAIATVPLLVYVGSLGTTLCMKRLSTSLGWLWAFTLGAAAIALACGGMMIATPHSSWLVYPSALSLGVGCAIVSVLSVSAEADLIGPYTESGAFVYGAISLTDKMSNGIAVLAIQSWGDTIDGAGPHGTFVKYVNALVPLVSIALALLVATRLSAVQPPAPTVTSPAQGGGRSPGGRRGRHTGTTGAGGVGFAPSPHYSATSSTVGGASISGTGTARAVAFTVDSGEGRRGGAGRAGSPSRSNGPSRDGSQNSRTSNYTAASDSTASQLSASLLGNA